MSDNELTHYGIPNMRWGERRYQYKDGSLTPAGKKRYAKPKTKDSSDGAKKPAVSKSTTKKGSNTDPKKTIDNLLAKMKSAKAEKAKLKEAEKAEKAKLKEAEKEAEAKKKKPLDQMTDDEIRQRISRIKLEKEYLSVTATEDSKTKQFIDRAIDKVANTFVDQGVPKIVNSLIDKALKDKTVTDPDADNSRSLLKKSFEKLTDKELEQLAKRSKNEKEVSSMYNDVDSNNSKTKKPKDKKSEDDVDNNSKTKKPKDKKSDDDIDDNNGKTKKSKDKKPEDDMDDDNNKTKKSKDKKPEDDIDDIDDVDDYNSKPKTKKPEDDVDDYNSKPKTKKPEDDIDDTDDDDYIDDNNSKTKKSEDDDRLVEEGRRELQNEYDRRQRESERNRQEAEIEERKRQEETDAEERQTSKKVDDYDYPPEYYANKAVGVIDSVLDKGLDYVYDNPDKLHNAASVGKDVISGLLGISKNDSKYGGWTLEDGDWHKD